MFRWCSAIDLRTPVMSASFQENMSNLFLSMSQSSIFPFSDRLPPIVTVCSDIQDGLPLLSLLMLLARLGRFIRSFRYHSAFCWYYDAAVKCDYSFFYWELEQTVNCGWNFLDFPKAWPINDTADPPSTYMRWMRWPSTSASITSGLSCLSLLASGGNEIS
ncbi:hypothetical protein Tco_0278100 [Tanacetum coccineum]